jgi:hypothetical protein
MRTAHRNTRQPPYIHVIQQPTPFPPTVMEDEITLHKACYKFVARCGGMWTGLFARRWVVRHPNHDRDRMIVPRGNLHRTCSWLCVSHSALGEVLRSRIGSEMIFEVVVDGRWKRKEWGMVALCAMVRRKDVSCTQGTPGNRPLLC